LHHHPVRHRARPLLIGLLAPVVALAVACEPAPPPSTQPPAPMPEVEAVDPADFGAAAPGSTAYAAPADARWVAPDGDDAGLGTAEQPWRTLGRAVQAAPGGGTVVLRGGTYRESVEVPSTRRLTIQAAPGEAVWMSGSDPVTGFVESGGLWIRPEFSSPFSAGTLDPSLVTSTSPLAGDPDMVFLDGRPLRQVGSLAGVVPTTFFVDDLARRLVLGEDPGERSVEVATRPEALTVKSAGSVVRGIGFRHYATHISRLGAVKARASGITFENDLFVDNAAAGLSVMAPDVQVRAVTASGNGQLGIHGDGANGLVVEDSLLRENNLERFSAMAASGGIKVTGSDGIVLRHNLVEDNRSHGLWMDLGSDAARVVRNVSRRNSAAGIIIEMSITEVVASNVTVDNEVGVIISETSGAAVWNNVILGNVRSLYVVDGWRAPEPVDITIRNNVVAPAGGGSRPSLIVDDVNQRRSGFDMRVTSDRNAYYRRATTEAPYLAAWANYPSGKFVLKTLAEVQSRTGQERTSRITDNAAANPYVADADSGRYGLPAGSPLAGAGVPLSTTVAAALGLPAGSAVPIGIVPT
jgi:hypothetical protein